MPSCPELPNMCTCPLFLPAGVSSGKCRVEITAVRNNDRKVTNPRDGKMMDENEQFNSAR
jgi:hypothetical protein